MAENGVTRVRGTPKVIPTSDVTSKRGRLPLGPSRSHATPASWKGKWQKCMFQAPSQGEGRCSSPPRSVQLRARKGRMT